MTVVRLRIEPDSHADTFDKFRDPTHPQDAREHSITGPSSCRAIVASKYGRKFCEASPETLQMLSLVEAKEVQWYFEQYLLHDPFSTSRAEVVQRRLKQHAKNLIKDFLVPEVCPSSLDAFELLIEIHDARHVRPSNVNDSLHRFYWEALEDNTIWEALTVRTPLRVCVVRVHLPGRAYVPQISSDSLPSSSPSKSRHVLAVTARPSHLDDIPYRLITRSIAAAVSALVSSTEAKPSLEIVRPGTFQALNTHLHKYPAGHFEIVHLDLHGEADLNGAKLTFVKYDAYMRPFPDPRTAEELANLFAERGVRIVVINACRSALGPDESSNVARLLVKAGLDVAIGMSFNVLSATAAHFMQIFYQSFLGQDMPAIVATQNARHSLRTLPPRLNKFLTTSVLEDHIVPVIHCNESVVHEMLHEKMDKPFEAISASSSDHATDLIGREGNLLEMESFLSQHSGLKIHIQGPPGIGKTTLLEQAASWWLETGLYLHIVHIQLHEGKESELTVDSIVHRICRILTIETESRSQQSLIGELDKEDSLLILDSLESITWASSLSKAEHERDLKSFLRRLKRCSVILSSRESDAWLGYSVCQSWLSIGALDLLSSTSYAHALLAHDSKFTVTKQNTDYFDQLIVLAQGNPLALRILILNLEKHLSDDRDATIQSHLISILQTQPLHLDLDMLRNDPSARAVTELLNMFTGPSGESDPSAWRSQSSTSSNDRTIATSLASLDLAGQISCTSTFSLGLHLGRDFSTKQLLLCSLAIFWHNIPGQFEPFTSALAALVIARTGLSPRNFESTRNGLRSLVEDGFDASQPLCRAIEKLMEHVMKSLAKPAKEWLPTALEYEESMSALLQSELSTFVELLAVQRRGDNDCSFFRSFYVISPLVTLVALHKTGKMKPSSGLKENFEVARAALYDYQLFYWISKNAVKPGTSGRESTKMEMDFDFFNHLSLSISYQNLDSWVSGGDLQAQYILTDVAALEPRRVNLVLLVLKRFLAIAIPRITGIRKYFYRPELGNYDVCSQIKHQTEWNLVSNLEMACANTIIQASVLCGFFMKPYEELLDYWQGLVDKPMFHFYEKFDGPTKEMLRISLEQNSLIFGLMGKSIDPTLIEEAAKAVDRLTDAELRLSGTRLGGISEGVPAPAESAQKQFQDQVMLQLGLQNTINGRIVSIAVKALKESSQESAFTAISELETLLREVVEGSNDPHHRVLIHAHLASLHARTGNKAVALQHHRIKDDMQAAFDPAILAKVQQVGNIFALLSQKKSMAGQVISTKTEKLERRLEEEQTELVKIQDERGTNSLPSILLSEKVAATLSLLGEKRRAVTYYREAIRARQQLLSMNDPGTLSTMSALARVLIDLREHEESIRLCRIVRGAYKELTNKRYEYLEETENLGYYLSRYVQSQGDWLSPARRKDLFDEAETHLKESVANDGEVAGLSDRSTRYSLQQLSWICSLQGRHEEAEVWIKEAINLANVANISLLDYQNTLALIYGNMNRRADAEWLHNWILEQRVEAGGYRDSATLSSFGNLILQYQESNKDDDIRKLLDDFIPKYRKSLDEIGGNHASQQNTLEVEQAKMELGLTLKRANRFSDCITVLEEITPVWEGKQARRAQLAEIYGQIAHCYSKPEVDNWRKSFEARLKSMSLIKDLYGPNHRRTLDCMSSLAISLARLDRYNEAVALQKDVITELADILGPDHADTLIEKFNLGHFLVSMEDWASAHTILRKVFDTMIEIAPTWTHTLNAARSLGKACAMLKQYQEAARCYRTAANIALEGSDTINHFALRDLNDAIENLKLAGEFAEAREVLDISRKAWRGDEIGRIHCALIEATLLRREGNLDTSESLVWKILEEELPPSRLKMDVLRPRAFAQLATIYEDRKNYDRAIELWHEAIDERLQTKVDWMPTQLDLLGNLTDSCIAGNKWLDAERALRERLRIIASLPSPQLRAKSEAACQALLSQVLQQQGKSVETSKTEST